MRVQAKILSRGRVTIPIEIRRRLGMRAGDRLAFEEDRAGMRVSLVRKESPFEKYRGIGNPGIGQGRKGIQTWLRELRGE
jgi:AbrB family looped-hinge helix DNA binding protein